MYNSKVKLFVIISSIIICNSCLRPRPVIYEPKIDQWGCTIPPSSVFTSVGIDLEFAQATYNEIVSGDLKIKTRPEVISLASKAATDAQIKSYLNCLALKRDGYTIEQVAYQEQMSALLQTAPSAEQFIEWQKSSPFPSSNEISKQLKMVEKEAFSEKEITCIGKPGDVGDAHTERIEVSIPLDAEVIKVFAYMKNASWMSGGVPCRSDLGSTNYQTCEIDKGDCHIKWSKVTDLQEYRRRDFKIISAKFWNWRHDNERTGKLLVKYKIWE